MDTYLYISTTMTLLYSYVGGLRGPPRQHMRLRVALLRRRVQGMPGLNSSPLCTGGSSSVSVAYSCVATRVFPLYNISSRPVKARRTVLNQPSIPRMVLWRGRAL